MEVSEYDVTHMNFFFRTVINFKEDSSVEKLMLKLSDSHSTNNSTEAKLSKALDEIRNKLDDENFGARTNVQKVDHVCKEKSRITHATIRANLQKR